MTKLSVLCLCATSSKNVTIKLSENLIIGHWKCEICLREMQVVIHEVRKLEHDWPGEKERLVDRVAQNAAH